MTIFRLPSRPVVLAAFAAGLAVAPLAVSPALAASTPLMTAAAQAEQVDVFYRHDPAARLWLREGAGAPAVERLVEILRRAQVEGLAEGPTLAATVEAAYQRALASNKAEDALLAERTLSGAWLRYVAMLDAPIAGVLYGDARVKPLPPNVWRILTDARTAPVLADHLRARAWRNPTYDALRGLLWKDGAPVTGPDTPSLMANLERARMLPADGRFIVVNAADAMLTMYEKGQPVDRMKVVVGKNEFPTPMIASTIYYATYNPYWHVPDHLVRNVAARVVSDGYKYFDGRYQVVDSWSENPKVVDPKTVDWKTVAAGKALVKLRELPNPKNSMGMVKFNFANPEGIYLHDTPNKDYFRQSKRTLSNGCIRLEDAERLKKWLFDGTTPPAVKEVEKHVALPSAVPVFVTYLTKLPSGSQVALLPDYYGLDPAKAPAKAAVKAPTSAGGSMN